LESQIICGIGVVNANALSRVKLTRRPAISSEDPEFSWETFLLVTGRRRVGDPVDATADILIDSFGYPREYDCQQRQLICALARRKRRTDPERWFRRLCVCLDGGGKSESTKIEDES